MEKFFRDCKGVVTVFVTLMLIPAVLICGTGVDLARIFAARSILRDANQLAANSALANYDALLQDLYGLYGVMKDDPEFADMVDRYIELTVLTEDGETGMGTFQLFYGSNLTPGDVIPAEGQDLGEIEVLRRQIEEYAKFRAPAVIAEDVLDRLDVFKKVNKDAEVIKDKMDIDDKIEDIDELYRKIYDCIQELDQIDALERSAVESVNEYLRQIEACIDDLYETRNNDYTEAALRDDQDAAGDYETKYEGLLDNLHALIRGGRINEGWSMGGYDDAGNYVTGSWISSRQTGGINNAIGTYTRQLRDKYDVLDRLVELCREADQERADLERKVDRLEHKLNSGECSEDLRIGMTDPSKGVDGRSVLEQYRGLLQYDLTAMAQAVRERDGAQVQRVIDMLQGCAYGGQIGTTGTYSRDILMRLSRSEVPIDYVEQDYAHMYPNQVDVLRELDKIGPDQYELKIEDRFKAFQDPVFSGTRNPEFYRELERLYGGDGSKKSVKKNVTQGLTKMLGKVQERFGTFLVFDPAGAYRYENGFQTGSVGEGTDFGQSEFGDWGEEGKAKELTKEALDANLIVQLGSMLDDAGNKILLLTYDSEMFSCYTTPDGSKEGVTAEKNMNGIPLGVDVNYYFQSELEYLYRGDLQDARSNLKAVTGMLFLVRFVFNYIASFSIDEINATVNSVKSALSWSGPFAVVAGELVRLVLALGESVMDVSRLKDGAQVALFKRNDTWRFKLTGLLDSIGEGVVGELSDSSFSGGREDEDPQPALSYKDYLRLFLLLVDSGDLALRTARLIELNMTNKRGGFGDLPDWNAREAAMKEAELFQMNNAVTGFSLTTTADLRMLFLSMPFARRGAGGTIPPGTIPISVTDRRGY